MDCTPMISLSTSTFLKTSLVINTTIALCALPVLFWATWKLWSMKYAKLFHSNFKILIQLHLFGFIVHSGARIILHSIDFYNYTFQDDPCDMIPNIYRCFILRLLYNSGLWLTNSTTVSLIIERWLATKRSWTYEEDSIIIGFLLAFMQFVIASIPIILLYWNTTFEQGSMYYCVAAKATMPYFPQLSSATFICFQIAARISFHYLYRLNKVRIADVYTSADKNSIQHLRNTAFQSTLSNRYQLEQNISSIACLKTFANISSVYVIIQNGCFIALMHYASSLHSYQYYAITELNGSFPIYSIITIAIMSNTIKKVKNSIGNTLNVHLKTPNNIYFDNFIKQIA